MGSNPICIKTDYCSPLNWDKFLHMHYHEYEVTILVAQYYA